MLTRSPYVYFQVTVEATLEHPFFVFGQGWSSCSPDRTSTRYGLVCHRLIVGDVCISLTHKETLAAPMPSHNSRETALAPVRGERPHSSEHPMLPPGGGSGGTAWNSAGTLTAPGSGAGGLKRRWSAPDLSNLQSPPPPPPHTLATVPPPSAMETSHYGNQSPPALATVQVKQEESDSDSDVDVDMPATSTSSPQPHT